MALEADVVGTDEIEAGRVDDVAARRFGNMIAAGAVALFAADVPFGHCVIRDVVVDGVATVAEGSGGAFGLALGVDVGPPVGAFRRVVGTPDFVGDIPLNGINEVIVTLLVEVALLPFVAVQEGDIGKFEGDEGVGFGEVSCNCFGVGFGVADDVGHTRL